MPEPMIQPHTGYQPPNTGVLGLCNQPRSGMMTLGNISRRLWATLLHQGVACGLLALAITADRTLAAALSTQPPTVPVSASGLPDVEQVRTAHALARSWLDQFDTPHMDDPQSRVTVDHARALCVILRRHGRPMGIGLDATGDSLMIRRALGRAMNEALGDPALQAVAADLRRGGAPTDRQQPADIDPAAKKAPGAPVTPVGPRVDPEAEARIERLRIDLGRSLTLEIEVAGELTPLVGRSLEQMAGKVDAGLDGVAVRRDGNWTHLFPSQQRVTNTLAEPERMLTSAGLSAGIPMSELGADLGARPDVGFYRFSTIDLAQASPTDAPVELFRGNVLVSIDDVTRSSVADLADRLVDHVLTHLWPAPPAPLPGQPPLPTLPMGMRGDYSPAADQYQPAVAGPMEQALCAWALVRYAQCESVDRDRAGKAAAAARTILIDMANVHQREMEPRDDPGTCAVLMYIAADSPSMFNDPLIGELVHTAAARVSRSFDVANGFRWTIKVEGAGAVGQPLPAVSRAMIAGAMARLLAAKVNNLATPTPEVAALALESAWSSVGESNRVALLPWIGWAARDLTNATVNAARHMNDLRQVVGALEHARVSSDVSRADSLAKDLDGGFALTSEDSVRARPSAQSLRPMVWLARAARDSDLVPADRADLAWSEHLRSVRFLLQLAVSDLQAAMHRDAGRCRGGICTSVWDSRQPLAAQALGLLTAVETLQGWPASD